MLFKSINDARFSYTYRMLGYAGKPLTLPSPFYVSGTEKYVKELVTSLNHHVSLEGRNISMDRLYTSIALAQWLLSKNITCIGTMQMRRVGIPEEVKSTKQRENFSTRMYWEKESGDMTLTSYVVLTSTGVKNVLVLSTMRPLQGITKDDGKQKPSIFKLNAFTKGGTTVVDQRIAKFTTKVKPPK